MNKLLSIILIFILFFFGYGIYDNLNKTQAKKEKRLPCQEKTITFENISNKSLIPEAINLLKTNNYKISSRIELSKYMKSKILNFISKEEADIFLEKIIKTYIKSDIKSEKNLLIDYYIYENDKEDKGKKSD